MPILFFSRGAKPPSRSGLQEEEWSEEGRSHQDGYSRHVAEKALSGTGSGHGLGITCDTCHVSVSAASHVFGYCGKMFCVSCEPFDTHFGHQSRRKPQYFCEGVYMNFVTHIPTLGKQKIESIAVTMVMARVLSSARAAVMTVLMALMWTLIMLVIM